MLGCLLRNTPRPYGEATMSEHTEKQYTVEGMTCGHCVLSVKEEVAEVAGVAGVDVDLESGRLTVRGDDVSDEAVESAVTEAGYRVSR
jgi:copper chaperone